MIDLTDNRKGQKKMIEQLIEKAKKIEKETDANIGGAFVQVTKNLTIDECETIFVEYAGQDEKKIKRYAKKILRAKSGDRYFDVNSLRNDAMSLLEFVNRTV